MPLIFLLYVCHINVVIYPRRCFIQLLGPRFYVYVELLHIITFFLISARSLIDRMRKQGADTQGIQRVVAKMIGRHLKPFEKYGIAAEQIALDISSPTWFLISFWLCNGSHFDSMILKSEICNLASRHSTPTEGDIRRWQFLCTLFSESKQWRRMAMSTFTLPK